MGTSKITAKDCRKCGLCCVSLHDQDALADVTQKDMDRLNPRWASANVLAMSSFDFVVAAVNGRRLPPGAIRTKWKLQRCGPLRGVAACACVALRGSVLHRTSCSIYKRRPDSCRTAVKPGDQACLEIRRHWSEHVQEVCDD